jgi:hypothetical protein
MAKEFDIDLELEDLLKPTSLTTEEPTDTSVYKMYSSDFGGPIDFDILNQETPIINNLFEDNNKFIPDPGYAELIKYSIDYNMPYTGKTWGEAWGEELEELTEDITAGGKWLHKKLQGTPSEDGVMGSPLMPFPPVGFARLGSLTRGLVKKGFGKSRHTINLKSDLNRAFETFYKMPIPFTKQNLWDVSFPAIRNTLIAEHLLENIEMPSYNLEGEEIAKNLASYLYGISKDLGEYTETGTAAIDFFLSDRLKNLVSLDEEGRADMSYWDMLGLVPSKRAVGASYDAALIPINKVLELPGRGLDIIFKRAGFTEGIAHPVVDKALKGLGWFGTVGGTVGGTAYTVSGDIPAALGGGFDYIRPIDEGFESFVKNVGYDRSIKGVDIQLQALQNILYQVTSKEFGSGKNIRLIPASEDALMDVLPKIQGSGYSGRYAEDPFGKYSNIFYKDPGMSKEKFEAFYPNRDYEKENWKQLPFSLNEDGAIIYPEGPVDLLGKMNPFTAILAELQHEWQDLNPLYNIEIGADRLAMLGFFSTPEGHELMEKYQDEGLTYNEAKSRVTRDYEAIMYSEGAESPESIHKKTDKWLSKAYLLTVQDIESGKLKVNEENPYIKDLAPIIKLPQEDMDAAAAKIEWLKD